MQTPEEAVLPKEFGRHERPVPGQTAPVPQNPRKWQDLGKPTLGAQGRGNEEGGMKMVRRRKDAQD